MVLRSRAALPLASPLLLVVAALAACKQPVAGECLGLPGALCITVHGTAEMMPPLQYVLDVRIGAGCAAVAPFRCQSGMAPATPGCLESCQTGPVPERFFAGGRVFTAEIDLSHAPGAGEVLGRVYRADNTCVAQGDKPWPAPAPAALDLALHPEGCPKTCTSHLDCGGARAAQVCLPDAVTGVKICQDPPANVCPAGMAFVPAGSLVMGNPDASAIYFEAQCLQKEGTPRRISISQPLCVDTTEATVAQYRACAGCTAPPADPGCTYVAGDTSGDGRAMNCLTQEQAAAYCASRNARLPSESEWEWIAGRDAPKLEWPWAATSPGDICQHANALSDAGTPCTANMPPVLPPGQKPAGDPPAGLPWPTLPIHDLAGNLSEWVADSTGVTMMQNPACHGMDGTCFHSLCEVPDGGAPFGPNNELGYRLYRGGSYNDNANSLRTFSRYKIDATQQSVIYKEVGVRCVLNPPGLSL